MFFDCKKYLRLLKKLFSRGDILKQFLLQIWPLIQSHKEGIHVKTQYCTEVAWKQTCFFHGSYTTPSELCVWIDVWTPAWQTQGFGGLQKLNRETIFQQEKNLKLWL